MKDKKISPSELEKKGLIVDDEEIIPPLKEKAQSNLRHKRRIPYYMFCGRVYYDQSDLIAWAQKQKVNIAS